MNRIAKKGAKLIEQVEKKVPLMKIDEMKDFYLRRQNTPFAIRNVTAYHIPGTDAILVLGGLDLAAKTAHMNERQKPVHEEPEEESEPEEEEAPKESAPAEEEDPEEMERSINLVMDYGKVTREEAAAMLRTHDNDPLKCMLSLDAKAEKEAKP
ncbi:hypothetical protein NECID01_0452 [Nematocida sp. AWRm77]|nr:hypothetical protein NECID01_0452 [Nematocida sp. AWRm77]